MLRDNLNTQAEKRETSTQTWKETMLRDKLRIFLSNWIELEISIAW